MLKAIHTKLLLAILTALVVIGAAVIHANEVKEREREAARAALLLQQRKDADDAAKKQDAELWKAVEENKKKHNSYAGNGSRTWQKYIP